MHIEDIVINI